MTVQARKGYLSLVGPRRTFAIIRASTKKRVEPAMRLEDVKLSGRLLPAPSIGNDTTTPRIGLSSVEEIDDEVVEWFRRAYDQNL